MVAPSSKPLVLVASLVLMAVLCLPAPLRAAPPDGDGDGVPDNADNCPTVPNPEQIDLQHLICGPSQAVTLQPGQDSSGPGSGTRWTMPAIASRQASTSCAATSPSTRRCSPEGC